MNLKAAAFGGWELGAGEKEEQETYEFHYFVNYLNFKPHTVDP